MNHTQRNPAIVRWTLRLENAESLDRPVRALAPSIKAVFGRGRRAWLLRGDWLGHAIHPLLTDATIGTWTSASILDMVGGQDESAAAQRLIGSGLLAAVPTALTGWAEWSTAEPRDKRVGLIHAGINGLSISIYLASWVTRRRGRHKIGARLALGGAAVSALSAYLGGHLAAARKVATSHPAYNRPSAGVSSK